LGLGQGLPKPWWVGPIVDWQGLAEGSLPGGGIPECTLFSRGCVNRLALLAVLRAGEA